MTTTPRPNPGHGTVRRTPAYAGKPMDYLHITFNQPPRPGKGTQATTYAGRRWPQVQPTMTGELLLAALKENA